METQKIYLSWTFVCYRNGVYSSMRENVFKHVFIDVCIIFISFISHLYSVSFKYILHEVCESGHPEHVSQLMHVDTNNFELNLIFIL
jgi:hypothetical protein